MNKFPPDALPLGFAAKKYGFSWHALRKAIERDRLEGFKNDGVWYTTDRAIKKYLDTRNEEKIPKRYRKKRT